MTDKYYSKDSPRQCHVSFDFPPCFIHHIWYFKICSSSYRTFSNIKSHLPKRPCAAFCNLKTLRDKLVRSKLRPYYEEERGFFICDRRSCDICNILEPGNDFKSTTTGKVYKINFHFHCISECVVYFLTCKICRRRYVGSTMTKFRLRFNQYKSKLN